MSTAPLGTSTGGFTFTFDPQLRTWTRSASSFGPSFAERSLTTGRAKVSAGFNVLHASYDSFAGFDLQNGDFHPSQNVRSNLTPIASTSVKLNLTSDTVVGFAHVGVTTTSTWACGAWVNIGLDADGFFFNAAGADISVGRHQVIPRPHRASATSRCSAKYQLWRREWGVAVAIESSFDRRQGRLRGLASRVLTSVIWSRAGRSRRMPMPVLNTGPTTSRSRPMDRSSPGAKRSMRSASNTGPIRAATIVADIVGRRVHGGQVG